MELSIWDKTNGTWINVGTVLLGTAIGLLLGNRLRPSFLTIITQAVGLITLFVGFTMAANLLKVKAGPFDGIILGLITALIGGIGGEWWLLEEKLRAVGEWLKKKLQRGGNVAGRFTEGFVTASLLFCVGPMTILGCLNNGLTGDNRILVLKSTMDGFAAIALTSTLGIGVGFSGLLVLLYQGGLSLSAGLLSQFLSNPATDQRILLLSGVGGLMIIGLGLNLLEVTKIRVASFLPALPLAPLLYAIAQGIAAKIAAQ